MNEGIMNGCTNVLIIKRFMPQAKTPIHNS